MPRHATPRATRHVPYATCTLPAPANCSPWRVGPRVNDLLRVLTVLRRGDHHLLGAQCLLLYACHREDKTQVPEACVPGDPRERLVAPSERIGQLEGAMVRRVGRDAAQLPLRRVGAGRAVLPRFRLPQAPLVNQYPAPPPPSTPTIAPLRIWIPGF